MLHLHLVQLFLLQGLMVGVFLPGSPGGVALANKNVGKIL